MCDSRVVICGRTHTSFVSAVNLIFGLQDIFIYQSAVELILNRTDLFSGFSSGVSNSIAQTRHGQQLD